MKETKQIIIYGQVPDKESVARLKAAASEGDGWLLFPSNSRVVMPEQVEAIRLALSPLGLVEWVENYQERFDRAVTQLGERLERFSREVRDAKVAGKSISDHLSGIGMEESAWWFSLLQERNPLLYPDWNDWAKRSMIEEFLRENTFKRVVLLGVESVLSEAIEEMIVELTGDPSSCMAFPSVGSIEPSKRRSVLGDFLSGGRELLLLGRRIYQGRSLRRCTESHPLATSKVVHVGYFPAAEPIAAREGVFRNRYLGDLQQIIEDETGPLGFLFFAVPGDAFPFSKCVQEVKRFREAGYAMKLQEEYLGFSDWLKIGISWVRLFLRSNHLLKAICDELVGQGILRKSERVLFTELWKTSFRSHLAGKGFFNYHAFRNALRTLPGKTQVLYAAEFQSWEYMLNLAASSVGRQGLVAMLQGNPARNYFQYRFDRTTKESGPAFPKRIVSFSPVFDSLQSLSEVRITHGNAIRLMHLQGFEDRIDARRKGKTNRTLGILGAGSYDECVLMLGLLHGALKKTPAKIRVCLRLHPVISHESLSSMLGFDLQDAGIEIATGTMDDLLTESTAIYVSNSTSAIEALAYGCEVISPRYFGRLSLCPLDGHESYYWRVSNENELADAIAEIMRGEQRSSTEPLTRFLSEFINLDKTYSTWRRLIGEIKP